MDSFVKLLTSLANSQDLVYLTILVVVNIITGAAAALATNTFNLAKLTAFVETRLVPSYLAYLAVAFMTYGNPSLSAAPTVVFGAISLRLFSYIATNFTEMGIPLPSIVTNPGGVIATIGVSKPTAAPKV